MGLYKVAASVLLLSLLAGCSASDPVLTMAPTNTPSAQTAVPTPTATPRITPLEEAFAYAAQMTLSDPGDESMVFPQSSTKLLGAAELRNATPYELEWAWREIAARRGMTKFKSHNFGNREWYEPDPDFSNENLSQVEATNLINIRNEALAHYTLMKTVRNNSAKADLDGDGVQEAFSFAADRFSDEGTLKIKGKSFTISLPQLDGKIYLCDIDRNDGFSELAIPYTQKGLDVRIAFYRYSQGELTFIGDVPGDRTTLRLFGDGTLYGHGLETVPCAYRYRLPYQLEDGLLTPSQPDLLPINIATKTAQAMELTDEKGNVFPIQPGEDVVLMLAMGDRMIVLHSASGRMGVCAKTAEKDSAPLFDLLPSFA